MPPINTKLNEVFNKCAGKIVTFYEIEEFVMNKLEAQLTRQEMDVYKAITSADFVKRFTADGVIPEPSTPEELATLIRNDMSDVRDGSVF